MKIIRTKRNTKVKNTVLIDSKASWGYDLKTNITSLTMSNNDYWYEIELSPGEVAKLLANSVDLLIERRKR